MDHVAPPSPDPLRVAPLLEAPWGALMPEDQWETFLSGAAALTDEKIEFRLHGAMALATYTGHWRNTKDTDVIIRPPDAPVAIEALTRAGFGDYYEREAYDRSWIFRGWRGGMIFDVIWALPNHRVAIDDAWFERGSRVSVRGRPFTTVPPEELIRVKLYVLQRERCDWPDVLNVLASVAHRVDWEWLVARMERDLPLLQAALAVFAWMCPGRARALPEWLREKFAIVPAEPDDPAAMEERRVRLFDTRPWFAAHEPLAAVLAH